MGTMTLTRGDTGWHGTFTVALRALVEDILSDGLPFEATVTTETAGPQLAVVAAATPAGFGSEHEWFRWDEVSSIAVE